MWPAHFKGKLSSAYTCYYLFSSNMPCPQHTASQRTSPLVRGLPRIVLGNRGREREDGNGCSYRGRPSLRPRDATGKGHGTRERSAGILALALATSSLQQLDVLVSLHIKTFTASLNHMRTMLPESSSQPLPAKRPITQHNPYLTRNPCKPT